METNEGLGSTDWEVFKADLRKMALDAPGRAELFEKIGKRFLNLPGIVLVWVGLIDREGRTVIPIYEAGPCGAYLDQNKFTLDETVYGAGPTGRAIKTRLPAVLNDVADDPDYIPWREKAKTFGFASTAALPFWTSGNLTGVLNLYSTQQRAFTEEVQKRLGEITCLIAECSVHIQDPK